MTSAQAMDIIYPLCTALLGGYTILKIAFLIYVRRTWIVTFDVLLLITETIVLGLLALLTGENPSFDIEQYRYLVTWTRGAMCVALILCILSILRSIWLSTRKHG
jgi:hypothetical protein